VNAIHLLRDALVRTVATSKALGSGDVIEASAILSDLEHHLTAGLAQFDDDVIRVCLDDFNTIPSYDRGDERIEAWCRAYLAGIA